MYVRNISNKYSRIFILQLDDCSNMNHKKKKFLEKILSYYNVGFSNIFYNKYGKPYLNNIYFNYSDTSKYIALIVGQNEVGIDIEEIRNIDTIMANKILNNRENNNYYNHDSVYLLKHWVGKEAYLKYIGTGIVDDLNKIDLESIEKENNCVSILNNYFCMYAFSKNKINTNIEYYREEEIL